MYVCVYLFKCMYHRINKGVNTSKHYNALVSNL